MKIIGAELLDWVNNHWPGNDWYIDDGEIEFEDIDPSETYNVEDFGVICYQGDDPGLRDLDMAKLIRQWRRERDYEIVVINVPRSDLLKVKQALAGFGIKVKS